MRIGTTLDPRFDIIEEIKSISKSEFDFVELHITDWIRNKKEEI